MLIPLKFRNGQFCQNLNVLPLLVALLLFSILPIKAYSQESIISSIVVNGNQRITTETIISISKIQKGVSYSPSELNSALQLIKKSTYFETASLSVQNDILKISVTEKPTINSINF